MGREEVKSFCLLCLLLKGDRTHLGMIIFIYYPATYFINLLCCNSMLW